jgi:HAD superfamily hydrolase (TIGR01509 family)
MYDEKHTSENSWMQNALGSLIGQKVKGVVFDMDGTLVTSHLDFNRIRSEAGVPAGIPVLEYIERAEEPQRRRALAVLVAHESRAARECALLPGAGEVLETLRERGLKLALLTRNSRESVSLVLERLALKFDCYVAREDAAPKPSPEPVLKIARILGLRAGQLLVVGDYVFDIESGRAAGAYTALLRTEKPLNPCPEADLFVDHLAELLDYFPAERDLAAPSNPAKGCHSSSSRPTGRDSG